MSLGARRPVKGWARRVSRIMYQLLRPLRNYSSALVFVSLILIWLMFSQFGRVPALLLGATLVIYAMCHIIGRLQSGYREQAIAASLVIAFYACSALTSVKPENITSVPAATEPPGFYPGLTESLLKGELTLPVKPGEGLLKAANPYQPGRNYPYVWDASYYQGKYYIYFGITPVLTLFLPFRVLAQRPLPTHFALLTFLVAGFIGSLFVLERARRKCGILRPAVPIQVLTVFVLGLGNVGPLMLRRPSVYEVAISSAYCFSMWGFYCLIGYFQNLSLRRALLASLFLGLAVGSRPTYGVTSGLIMIAAMTTVWLCWKVDGWGMALRVFVLVAPMATVALVLGLYNKLRFDSWTEFGLRYQLDHLDMYNMKLNVTNALHGAAFYLFSTPIYSQHFPGIRTNLNTHPFQLGNHVGLNEDVLGVLGAFPVTCFIVLIPFVAWYRRSRWTLLLATSLVGLAGFMVFAVSNVGISARYEQDFLPSFLLASTLAFYGTRRRGNGVFHGIAQALWVPAACFSILVGMLAPISDYQNNSLESYHPSTYRVLRQLLWSEGK